MAPFSTSKSTQNRSKLDPEGHPKIDTFSHRLPTLFCSILAPKMGPCWGQVGTKIASRAGPDLTLCRPDPFLVALGPLPGGSWTSTAVFKASRTLKMVPKSSQNGHQTTPKSTKIKTPGAFPESLAPEQAPIPAHARRNGAEPL